MVNEVCKFLNNKVEKRSVFVWGTSGVGEEVVTQLEKMGIEVVAFIDLEKNEQQYAGKIVCSFEYAMKQYMAPYIILAIAENPTVYQMLDSYGYEEYDDYLYFGKLIRINKCHNYLDVCGNKVDGDIDGVELELSGGSFVKVEKGAQIGKNVNIICKLCSEVYISKDVRIQDDVTIMAIEQSKVVLADKVTIERGTALKAKKESKIQIGLSVQDEEENIDYRPNGFSTEIKHGALVLASDRAYVKVGRRISIGHGLQLIVTHGTGFCCGDDSVLSYNVDIRGNQGHTIMDLKRHQVQKEKKDVILGQHVWVGFDVAMLPGTRLKRNCIVGAKSLTNKTYSANCVIAGSPAREVKEKINWDHSAFTSWEEFEHYVDV